jgi:hypothetical protein
MTLKNPDLLPLFDELKVLLEPYAERFTAVEPEPGRYELWSAREVSIGGRRPQKPYFVGLMIQKSFVGFYYMLLYTDPDVADQLGAELLATLKGKTCFRLKNLTPELVAQVEAALRIGLETYESRGWV